MGDEIAGTAGTEARQRTIFAPFGPLWGAKIRTIVDTLSHYSYYWAVRASRRAPLYASFIRYHRARQQPCRRRFSVVPIEAAPFEDGGRFGRALAWPMLRDLAKPSENHADQRSGKTRENVVVSRFRRQ